MTNIYYNKSHSNTNRNNPPGRATLTDSSLPASKEISRPYTTWNSVTVSKKSNPVSRLDANKSNLQPPTLFLQYCHPFCALVFLQVSRSYLCMYLSSLPCNLHITSMPFYMKFHPNNTWWILKIVKSSLRNSLHPKISSLSSSSNIIFRYFICIIISLRQHYLHVTHKSHRLPIRACKV